MVEYLHLKPWVAHPITTNNAESFAIEKPSKIEIDSIGEARKNKAIAMFRNVYLLICKLILISLYNL